VFSLVSCSTRWWLVCIISSVNIVVVFVRPDVSATGWDQPSQEQGHDGTEWVTAATECSHQSREGQCIPHTSHKWVVLRHLPMLLCIFRCTSFARECPHFWYNVMPVIALSQTIAIVYNVVKGWSHKLTLLKCDLRSYIYMSGVIVNWSRWKYELLESGLYIK